MLLLLLLICYGTVKAAKTVIFDSGRLSEITVPLCWWCWELSTPLLAMGACAALQPSPTHRCLQVMVEMLHAITLLCTWSQATAILSPELQEEITEGTFSFPRLCCSSTSAACWQHPPGEAPTAVTQRHRISWYPRVAGGRMALDTQQLHVSTSRPRDAI